MVCTRLLVLYTRRITECREFYTRLGLTFVRERHGNGPEHFAATLDDGFVLELYPGTPERITDALRLGFEVEPDRFGELDEPGEQGGPSGIGEQGGPGGLGGPGELDEPGRLGGPGRLGEGVHRDPDGRAVEVRVR